MKVINYRIELLEPALVTSLQGDPNSEVAFDYLPGSVLRGILIGKYLGSKLADAGDDTLQSLFFNGTTRYLNGYPLDAYGSLSLPVPLSWQRVKYDKEGKIFDFAVEAQDDKQQWQPVQASSYTQFYTQSGETVRLIRPERNVAVHTQRTARFGRAMLEYTDDDDTSGRREKLLGQDEIPGAVYRYDALAAGQKFQAAIICDNDADESTLKALISGRVTLGGSRSGGYGRAEISLVTDDASHRDVTEDDEDEPEDKLIVTLQSDVLLRDARGQLAVDPELLGHVLSSHLKLEAELKLEDAFLGTQLVAGFNRKWRLPLPQALAMRMGSVLVFKDPDCNSTLLRDLEIRSIGERRAEGFGRIVFNRQRVEELTVTEQKRQIQSSGNSAIKGTEAGNLAELMVKRMLRKRLDEGLLAAANNVKIANPPSNAQISRLRGLLLEEIRKATPDINKLRGFIMSIEKRGSARRQFERSILGSTPDDKEPLLVWLKRLLRYGSKGAWTMDDNDWKALLELKEVKVAIQIGNVDAEIDDRMRLEYVLRLIDLVLAKAAKQRGKEN